MPNSIRLLNSSVVSGISNPLGTLHRQRTRKTPYKCHWWTIWVLFTFPSWCMSPMPLSSSERILMYTPCTSPTTMWRKISMGGSKGGNVQMAGGWDVPAHLYNGWKLGNNAVESVRMGYLWYFKPQIYWTQSDSREQAKLIYQYAPGLWRTELLDQVTMTTTYKVERVIDMHSIKV